MLSLSVTVIEKSKEYVLSGVYLFLLLRKREKHIQNWNSLRLYHTAVCGTTLKKNWFMDVCVTLRESIIYCLSVLYFAALSGIGSETLG